MSNSAKLLISTALVALGVYLEVSGIRRMLSLRASGGVTGIGFVIGGAVIGCTAVVLHTYYKAAGDNVDPQKLEVETLANMPKKKPPTNFK